jgi:hypothetical protein
MLLYGFHLQTHFYADALRAYITCRNTSNESYLDLGFKGSEDAQCSLAAEYKRSEDHTVSVFRVAVL